MHSGLALLVCALAGALGSLPVESIRFEANCAAVVPPVQPDEKLPPEMLDKAWECAQTLIGSEFIWKVLENPELKSMAAWIRNIFYDLDYSVAKRLADGELESSEKDISNYYKSKVSKNREKIEKFCVPHMEIGGGKYVQYVDRTAKVLRSPELLENVGRAKPSSKVVEVTLFCQYALKRISQIKQ